LGYVAFTASAAGSAGFTASAGTSDTFGRANEGSVAWSKVEMNLEPASVVVTSPTLADLTLTKSHSGNFKQGDAVDTYTVSVSNVGSGSTTGLVTVSDTLPTGLSPTAADSGTINGWTVSTSGQTVTATRSDTLSAGATYPAFTVTVSVASNAPGSVTNTATVSGGGETNTTNDSATDSTTITQVADLTLTKTHTGNFRQGDPADTYTINVSNVGPGPTAGLVTVSDTLPTGLSPTAADSGTINGWTVSTSGQTVTATRSNVLTAGASYPALTVTVIVASNAPASVTNTATVSGGGEINTANDSATDSTTIAQVADLTVSKSHTGNFKWGDTADTYTINVSNVGPGPTTGLVTVSDTLPTGLSPTAADSGTINGWSVLTTGQTVTATRSDVLVAGASYPALTVTVAVASNPPASVTNTATVSGGGEINTANDTANDPTSIITQSVADLVVSASGQKTAVSGRDVIYQINVTNYGPGMAQNVVVTDTLPAGTTFVSATSSNAAMLPVATTVNGNGTTTVTFTGASMGVGALETIVLDATVNPNVTSGTLTNKVTVTTPTTQAANLGHSPVGSASFNTRVNVAGATLVPSMQTPGMMDLVITDGPASRNTIMVLPSGSNDMVMIDGGVQGAFACTGRIVVYGDDNDYEWISPAITRSAWLYGGNGTNYLFGGSGNDMIVGGPGTNYISGGSGRNLLIGGGGGNGGLNYIMGTTGDNIEISGTTSYDANQAALCAIVKEWDSGDSYSVRVQKITQTGLNVNGSTVVLNSSTIQQAAAREYLFGGSGQNLYFANETGSVFDRDYVIGRKWNETMLPN
jgi:uncharacterized repeat protein (TIGR01451 family)